MTTRFPSIPSSIVALSTEPAKSPADEVDVNTLVQDIINDVLMLPPSTPYTNLVMAAPGNSLLQDPKSIGVTGTAAAAMASPIRKPAIMHRVRRGDNLERIINRTYPNLDLSPKARRSLVLAIVSKNKPTYRAIRADLIHSGWKLRLPSQQEAAELTGVMARQASGDGGGIYTVNKDDTPLGIIQNNYRLGDGKTKLSAKQRLGILRLSEELNPSVRGLGRGMIRRGDRLNLPSPKLIEERLGFPTTSKVASGTVQPPTVKQVAAPSGDVHEHHSSLTREHIIDRGDNYYRIVKEQYVDAQGNALTAKDSFKLVRLIESINPDYDATALPLGGTLLLPSSDEINEHIGLKTKFAVEDQAGTDSAPVGKQIAFETLSRQAVETMRKTGVPASFILAESLIASNWGVGKADTDGARGQLQTHAELREASKALGMRGQKISEIAGFEFSINRLAADDYVASYMKSMLKTGLVGSKEEAANVQDIVKKHRLDRYDKFVQQTQRAPVADSDISAHGDWADNALQLKASQGRFLKSEPANNATGIAFPGWLDIDKFMRVNGLADTNGKPTSELTGIRGKGYARGELIGTTGPKPSSISSKYFILHETVGGPANYQRYRDGRSSDTRVNLFIGREPEDNYLGVDFSRSRTGTKGNSRRVGSGAKPLPRQGFISIEIRTPVKAGSNMYTESQYRSLAQAYVMASYRAGEMLTTVPHREVDRGVKNGHSDPRNFDWNRFYGEVNRLMDMPAGTTYGYQQSKDDAGGHKNYASDTNTFPRNIYLPAR